VNVFDRANHPIFDKDTANFTEYGRWVFSALAWQVSRYPSHFPVELEGHTEAGDPPKDAKYGKWEVSTDRANAARRLLMENGVKASQIRKVAGYADTIPLPDMDVSDERNRRVAVRLRVNQLLN
jgi:chemotaxis protein MotB